MINTYRMATVSHGSGDDLPSGPHCTWGGGGSGRLGDRLQVVHSFRPAPASTPPRAMYDSTLVHHLTEVEQSNRVLTLPYAYDYDHQKNAKTSTSAVGGARPTAADLVFWKLRDAAGAAGRHQLQKDWRHQRSRPGDLSQLRENPDARTPRRLPLGNVRGR